jgi:hypothetical protein
MTSADPPAPSAGRTTFERATAGYDRKFRRTLIEEITLAIGRVSIATNAPVIALRSTETIEALTIIIAATMALCPQYDTPSVLRHAVERLAKRIRREVGVARADPGFGADFFGVHREGHS